ncbi:MAG: discoidin domain-containing protein [Phycisphaerales bacterium]
MRKLSVLVAVLAMVGVCSLASAQAFNDDFESYAVGTTLHNIAGWKGWGNAVGAASPVSNKYAYSGLNSVEIVPAADLVHEFTANGGVWQFSAMQYIPKGTTGESYFILLNQYDDAGSANDWSVQLRHYLATGSITAESQGGGATATIIYGRWVQQKFIIDLDKNTCAWYYDGILITTHTWDDNNHTTLRAVDLYGNNASPVYYDDIRLAPYVAFRAYDPSPADEETDVMPDAQLSWKAEDATATHNVYFGTSHDDVAAASVADPRGVLVSESQEDTTFDPGPLEIGQTYYWRIDEVGGELGGDLVAGQVWSFTAELYSYPVDGDAITATASSTFSEAMTADRTVDGSGLSDDLHSTAPADMWLAHVTDFSPWIQYAFDKTYMLDKMLVWNSNQPIEPSIGFGVKTVTIQTSTDGETWTALGDFEFAQGTGLDGYEANTTVDFAGVAAKYVRLAISGNWGGLPGPAGLSEVRFYQVPTHARKPSPAFGAADVQPVVTLSWRAGRGADSHQVFVGADANSLALVDTVDEPACEVDLGLSGTYYWRVTEVSDANLWEGDLWSFTTADSVIVDSFESYNDDMDAETAIFQTWIDGIDDPTNGGGVVGHYPNPPFAERTIVHDGAQSMPFAYNNAGSYTYSDAVRTFDEAQDWTKYGVTTLSLWFYGNANNTGAGQLYVKINATKVSYSGAATDMTTAAWKQWTIDLASTGANLKKVTSLTVGVSGSGSQGSLLVDDIRLFP